MILANSDHNPLLSPSIPAPFPAQDMSWHGKPPQMMSIFLSTACRQRFAHRPRLGTLATFRLFVFVEGLFGNKVQSRQHIRRNVREAFRRGFLPPLPQKDVAHSLLRPFQNRVALGDYTVYQIRSLVGYARMFVAIIIQNAQRQQRAHLNAFDFLRGKSDNSRIPPFQLGHARFEPSRSLQTASTALCASSSYTSPLLISSPY